VIAVRQPMSDSGEGLAQKGRGRLRGVQAAKPAGERGGIGRPIGVFELGCRVLPGAVLHEAPPLRLTASQRTVVGVRERKQREEGEGIPATVAATSPDLNPVVMLIVRLLAAASVTDDRIMFTNGASPQDDLVAVSDPIGFELVQRGGKWDKKNRSSSGLCPALTCQDLSRKRSPPPPEEKIPTGRE